MGCMVLQYLARLIGLTACVAFSWLLAPAEARAQVACGDRQAGVAVCELPSLDAQGVTVRGSFDAVGQTRVYRFAVADEASTAQIYVGDLWYQVSVSLWQGGQGADDPGAGTTACSASRGCLAEAHRSERRVLQFLQPKSIVERLEPGSYALVVSASDDPSFDPSRGFTVRVALAPAACAVESDRRGEYQVGLIVRPATPRPGSLLSFSAFVSPPFGDLFDFEWTLDGEPLAEVTPGLAQQPVSQLAATGDGQHVIRVTARGARAYPDPDQPAVPPTVTVECTFRVE